MAILTQDASGNNNHGKLIGGAVGNARPTLVASPFAGFGNALSFDGVDRGPSGVQAVDCGTSAALDVSNAFCLEAKVQTGGTVPAVGAVIAGRYMASPSQQPVLYICSSTPQRFTIQTINSVEIKGTTTPQPNTKYDVAATYDGTTIRLFVNGVLEASAASGPCTASSNTRFMIGADDDAPGHGAPFAGTIDEVRLSKVARYTANYTPATTPFTADANTLGLWHLDTLSGRAPQPRVFRSTQTAPNASSVRDLSATEGTASNGNTVAAFATAGTVTTLRFNPNATTNVGVTIPAAPSVAADQGWRDQVAENANEQITYFPGTWALRVRLAKSGQLAATDITVRITAIVYWVTTGGVSTEIGRTTMPDTVISTADYVVAGSFTTASPVVVTAGGKLQTEVYVQPILAGLVAAPATAVNIIFYTDVPMASTPAEFTAIPDFSTTFARSGSEVTSYTDASARVVANTRTATETRPAQIDTASRVYSGSRVGTDVHPAFVDAGVRSATYRPVAADTLARMADSAQRQVTAARIGSDSHPAFLDTASRVVTYNRAAPDGTTQIDSAIRSVTFARITLYQFQPGDEVPSNQSRHIIGVVRNSDGTPYLGGATVILIREDGIVVQTQTSSTVNGSYDFPRNFLDTHTYTVAAFTTVGGSPYQAVTPRALSPV